MKYTIAVVSIFVMSIASLYAMEEKDIVQVVFTVFVGNSRVYGEERALAMVRPEMEFFDQNQRMRFLKKLQNRDSDLLDIAHHQKRKYQ